MADHVSNNVTECKADAVQSPINDAWLYRIAKRHGPVPQRKHWRPNRKGWQQWIQSPAGVEKIADNLLAEYVKRFLALNLEQPHEMVAEKAG